MWDIRNAYDWYSYLYSAEGGIIQFNAAPKLAVEISPSIRL